MKQTSEQVEFYPPCNLLVFIIISSKYGTIEIGILDTPCFPARFMQDHRRIGVSFLRLQ